MRQMHCPLLKERARGTQAHMSVVPLQCLPNGIVQYATHTFLGVRGRSSETQLRIQED